MTRTEFEEYFIAYRKNLREEVLRFRGYVAVYRRLQERKNDNLEAINLAPAFFQVVESALFSGIVLWANNLFYEKGERGLFNFLTFIENNRKWLSVKELQVRRQYPDGHWMLKDRIPITLETINADREKIRNMEAGKSFKLRRDKFHGHFDKDYFFDRNRLSIDAPLQWGDLESAGDLMGRIINDYSVDFDGTSYAWDPMNIGDLDILLSCASRGRMIG
jgi:hypothetical protein